MQFLTPWQSSESSRVWGAAFMSIQPSMDLLQSQEMLLGRSSQSPCVAVRQLVALARKTWEVLSKKDIFLWFFNHFEAAAV